MPTEKELWIPQSLRVHHNHLLHLRLPLIQGQMPVILPRRAMLRSSEVAAAAVPPHPKAAQQAEWNKPFLEQQLPRPAAQLLRERRQPRRRGPRELECAPPLPGPTPHAHGINHLQGGSSRSLVPPVEAIRLLQQPLPWLLVPQAHLSPSHAQSSGGLTLPALVRARHGPSPTPPLLLRIRRAARASVRALPVTSWSPPSPSPTLRWSPRAASPLVASGAARSPICRSSGRPRWCPRSDIAKPGIHSAHS
mmetsp:Transcript_40435/g.66945  ORF Transcript_40435/g.66945 Transcript_40435/m.66945 type:complete len:250 (+) Transcript_40435:1056-1805(+)